MRILVLLLLSGTLAGCLAPLPPGADCPEPATFVTPMVDGAYMRTAPGHPWQTVVLSSADSSQTTTHMAWSAAPGWTVQAEFLSPPGGPSFQVATVQPGDAAGNATLSFEVLARERPCPHERGSLVWDLMAPKAGDAAAPGQGVHVMTAGFLTNGTLFYTNIPEVDGDARWPRPAWYAWDGDAPLPVYVYDQDRNEQPDEWKAPSSQVPPTGTPLDPDLAQGGAAADGATGLGYFTTIKGFNAGLKGLPTTTVAVVRMDPEDAYTRPGNEDHPLYGEALVFLIRVLDVVDAPCPAAAPASLCQTDLPLAGNGRRS